MHKRGHMKAYAHTHLLLLLITVHLCVSAFFSGMRLIKTDRRDPVPTSIQPADQRGHKPFPGELTPLFSQPSHGLHKELAL